MNKKNLLVISGIAFVAVLAAAIYVMSRPPTTVAPTHGESDGESVEDAVVPEVADGGTDRTDDILRGIDAIDLEEDIAGDFRDVDSDLKGL